MPKLILMVHRVLSIVILFCVAISAFAQTNFVNGILNDNGQIILESKTITKRYGEITTLLQGNIQSNKWSVITTFPEYLKMVGTSDQRFFFLYNRFGLFRSNALLNNITSVEGFPSFADYQMIGALYAIEPSPDGRYVLYYMPTGAATGDLMLLNIETQESEIIIKDQPLRSKNPVVKWSPDSTYFIYERGYQLYYFAIDQVEIASQFRRLGPGTLNNIEWHTDNSLYYVLGSRVFRFHPTQIFLGTLYRDIFNSDLIVGYLFNNFRPTLDSFLISPKKDYIAVIRKEGKLFIQELQEQAQDAFKVRIMPLIIFSENESITYSGWAADNSFNVVSLVNIPGSKTSRLYNLGRSQNTWDITQSSIINAIQYVTLAPSGRHLAMIDIEGKVLLYTARDVERPQVVNDSDYYISAVWASPTQLILGGKKKIENMDIWGKRNFIAVSQPLTYGFLGSENNYPYVRTEEDEALYIVEGSWWRQQGSVLEVLPRVSENADYNIRFIKSSSIVFGNQPLIIKRREGTNMTPFDFRNNISRRLYGGSVNVGNKVAFAVDFTQTNIGVKESLDALDTNNVNASLFINGDFLQRYPTIARVLAYSNYEKGSLLIAYLDFSEVPYRVTADYLEKNLQQMEENYRLVTADTLSKIWHAPRYYINNSMRETSRQMGYVVVEPDFYLSRYTASSFDQGGRGSISGSSLAQLINAVISNVSDGDVIAFNGSLSYETTITGYQEYMFSKLEILIKALQNKGFDIVSMSELEKN